MRIAGDDPSEWVLYCAVKVGNGQASRAGGSALVALRGLIHCMSCYPFLSVSKTDL